MLRPVPILLAAALAPAVHAQSFSPPKGTATLTVKVSIEGGGDDIPASHERHVKWSVADRYVVDATMLAEPARGFPGLHKMDAAAQAREQVRAKEVQAAVADSGDMMAMAQAAAAKCGGDQACLMREVQAMSKKVDPARAASAKAHADAATAMPGNRYQLYQLGRQTGSWSVKETAHEAYFDAACSLKNEAKCSTDTQVNGEGRWPDGQGTTMAEWDSQAGTLVVQLPGSLVGQARRVVTSTADAKKNGSSEVSRSVPASMWKDMQTVSCGECRSAQGKFTLPVTDALLGRPAKMTVEWSFRRP